MVAEVLDGDTLAAIALRFHCTVADLKRLNKIDKEMEIYARKTVRIPITPQNALVLDNLPKIHKSGNNSPKNGGTIGNPQLNQLDEKLIVASVANSEYVNDVILNSTVANTVYHDFAEEAVGDPQIPNVVLAKPRNGFYDEWV